MYFHRHVFGPFPVLEWIAWHTTILGITVRVFGLANNNLSSYTIDGSNTTFPDATRSIYDILLYTSPILLDGQHNLTIDANNLTIDYFLVTPSGNTSTSRTATFMSSTFDTQPTDTSSMDLAQTRQSGHKKSIIAAVVALAIVAILGGFFLWLRRRRKNSESWGIATCQSFKDSSSFRVSHLLVSSLQQVYRSSACGIYSCPRCNPSWNDRTTVVSPGVSYERTSAIWCHRCRTLDWRSCCS